MRTVRSLWIQLAGLGPFLALVQCCGQGTFTRITFDGPPAIAPDTAKIVQQYYESGLSFTPSDPNAPWSGFGRRNGGGVYGLYPENGTAYLQAGMFGTISFSFMNGSAFGLLAVDLAEYSTVVPDAAIVHFVGYRHDGTSVTAEFTTDGIIDGAGPLADFQTFFFGPEFSGLDRVEIPSHGWSLDNLVLSIPEPGTGALVIVGAAMFGVRFLKRKTRPIEGSRTRSPTR